MLSRYFGSKIHTQIHVFLLCALASSIVVSKFVMSLSMMLLLLNILLEADFKSYWERIKSTRLFHWVAFLFAWHLISLLWSANWDYGFHDIKVTLPLIVIPLVLTCKPIGKRKRLKWVLGIFLATVLFASLYNFLSYQQVFGPRYYDDIRGMSLFDSHVRHALMVVMGIVIAVQFYRWRKLPVFAMVAIVVWLHFYTYYSQVLTGTIVLIGIYAVYGFYWMYHRYKYLAYTGLALFVGIIIASLIWIFKPITYDPAVFHKDILNQERTAEGNGYYNNPGEVSPETGKPIDIFICHKELKREWEKASEIPYYGRDKKGQYIFRTLTRYMASKDVRKDAEGFRSMSKKDIRAVEHGHTSIYHKGIWARVNGLRYQLNNATNPNGHSLLQRIEYWKVGVHLSKKNWLIGVGGGDIQDSFDAYYEATDSALTEEHRDRTHNMYLTMLLGFGIPGLFLLLISHVHYLRDQFRNGQLVGLGFIIIMMISYLVEDTLETQSGITYFGLFYGLYIIPMKKQRKS